MRKANKFADGQLPLLLANPPGYDPDVTFTITTILGHKYVRDLIFMLASFAAATGPAPLGPLLILSDGSLTPNDETLLRTWHPGTHIVHSLDELSEYTGCKFPPTIVTLASKIIWGKKLLLLIAAQHAADTLVLDSDIVFFADPLGPDSALSHHIAAGSPTCMLDCWDSSDPRVLALAAARGVRASDRVNDGLVYLPRNIFAQTDWERILPPHLAEDPYKYSHMACLAVALEEIGYTFLPRDTFFLTAEGGGFPGGDLPVFRDTDVPYDQLICRHFVTPIRHLMWLKAYPLIAHRLLQRAAPVAAPAVPAPAPA
jgi:hypothetical protein